MNRILEFASALIKDYRQGKSDHAPFLEKRIDGLLIKMDEVSKKYKDLQTIADERWGGKARAIAEITIVTDDIAIVEVTEKNNLVGYFYILGERASSTYSMDKETTILIALGEKYDGLNSQFSYYACKMLGKGLE